MFGNLAIPPSLTVRGFFPLDFVRKGSMCVGTMLVESTFVRGVGLVSVRSLELLQVKRGDEKDETSD